MLKRVRGKAMQEQLKELNKTLRNDFGAEPKKTKPKNTFKNFIILFLAISVSILFLSFSPYPGKILKREIIISAQGQVMGLVFSTIKQKNRINLLILGIPGEGHRGENMTDTIIVINSTPRGEKPIGISIPRDLLLKFPKQNYYTKINALFGSTKDRKQGLESVKLSLKEITGLDTDYFIIFDLEGIKNIIDQLEGIDVVVKNDIYDPKFPAPYDSYEIFSLKKGIHHLDGETTLKYIRSRNAPEGDFSRIERQQEVINILKNKILSLNFFWDFPTILKLWKGFGSHIFTNIDITDIKYAWNLASKTNLDTINFDTLGSEENNLLISGETILDKEKAYILKPKAGLDNYTEIKEYIKNLISNQL
jgi:LCP family protein required for cell wall assembly